MLAAAERLPVASGSTGLVVAAAALPWFDRPRTLAETVRVLTPGGGSATCTDFFSGAGDGAVTGTVCCCRAPG